ncbi:prephenate dehydrogenase [Bacillus sp. 2205SS5-2]|uniref:prephenate dehydrogenase n=1 Tax=Bacillus sp. 2205SS5-2 TaxID=3109031 RepID=UPI0030071260
MNKTVLIIGVGLIGGSLAKNIKHTYPTCRVMGFDAQQKDAELAVALGIIDEVAETIEGSAVEADLIILATPVIQTKQIIEILSQLSLKSDVIITDTGSTKKQILEKAILLKSKGFTFIGGHPMAGSHKTGVTAAKKVLFENAFYILIQDEENSTAIQTIQHWLKGTKAQFVLTTAQEHDYVTGVISHFPHLIASALVRLAASESEHSLLTRRFAAGGFRDITRIASSSPTMWKEITLENKQVLLTLIENWKQEMNLLSDLIQQENNEEILAFFQSAKEYRDELPQSTKGAIPAYYDLYIDVPDYPGIISEITGYLADERISLTNIRIVETREDIFGILVISFQNERDRQKASACIQGNTTYDVYLI